MSLQLIDPIGQRHHDRGELLDEASQADDALVVGLCGKAVWGGGVHESECGRLRLSSPLNSLL